MLEVIAMSVEDCVAIEKAGADRIELVSALSEGGLTPSIGMIEQCVEAVSLPIRVMIRPKSSSFCYSSYDLEVMKYDIEAVKEIGADGVVFGCLQANSRIDVKMLEKLLHVSKGLNVTFHRAFDELFDLEEGLRTLMDYPSINTILTSGGYGDLNERSAKLKQLIEQSDSSVEILIGGGITKENVDSVKALTKGKSYHIGRSARENADIYGKISIEQIRHIKNIIGV
ncbi:copper homeostasis protein CutC [Bacillus sp. AGMB 02131]|uniref:PF03932 family protein CutC n=1 Tax=Peribacillus faecalis TaxID=2772559 RepID=A0A927HB04_9BACI|nr:copper homeostasis protein CutC [Peribacillus faecalis]MBD3107976.1 copper homeostasis protein CutC [Peribacillus faecalis]